MKNTKKKMWNIVGIALVVYCLVSVTVAGWSNVYKLNNAEAQVDELESEAERLRLEIQQLKEQNNELEMEVLELEEEKKELSISNNMFRSLYYEYSDRRTLLLNILKEDDQQFDLDAAIRYISEVAYKISESYNSGEINQEEYSHCVDLLHERIEALRQGFENGVDKKTLKMQALTVCETVNWHLQSQFHNNNKVIEEEFDLYEINKILYGSHYVTDNIIMK